MLRRTTILAAFVLVTLGGCLETRQEKIYVRRVPPTKEELDAMPPPEYVDVLRREDAKRERLRVPLELHDETRFLDEGRKDMATALRVSKDPWASYESDRIRVIQSRNWADVGKAPPPEVLSKTETPIEDDPYAPVQKMGKKKADEGAETPDEGGEKKDE